MVTPSPLFRHVHVIEAFFLSPEQGGGYHPCAFENWSLFSPLCGAACITIGTQPVTLRTGELLLLPPQCCHAVQPEENARLLALAFESTEELSAGSYLRHTIPPTSIAASMLALLCSPSLIEDARDRLLEAFLLQSAAMPGLQIIAPPPDSLPLNILAYINAHFREELSLTDLTAVFHVSSSHIIHVFNPLFGLSPIQYLIRRRIGEAQLLLRKTDLNAAEIAGCVGIINRNYFYRTFKRFTGLSPSRYRELIRNGVPDEP